MAYKITIEKLDEPGGKALDGTPLRSRIYEQTVDELDLRAVMQAVNSKPRKPRKPKEEK
jgi:hypothetical protein